MALYQVDVQKVLGGEFWTNVYYCATETISEAGGFAQDVAAMEATFHDAQVRFDVARVRTTVEGDDVYTTVPLGFNGAVSIDRGGLLPLFNVVRVDLTALVGRPSRKYYRGCLAESEISFNTINPSYVTTITNAMNNFLATMAVPWVWTDLDDTPITGIVVQPNVGMRQLRRGSRRRTQPVVPQT